MTTSTHRTEHELHQLFDRMCAAWTEGDADAYGACFTEDCDYVSFDGVHTSGRQAMVDNHERLFRGVLDGSALVGQVEAIRHVAADVVVLHATGSVLMPWRSQLPRRRLSRQTIVAVHTDDGWKVTALHNGRVRPVTIPHPDALPSRASKTMSRVARALGIGHSPAARV